MVERKILTLTIFLIFFFTTMPIATTYSFYLEKNISRSFTTSSHKIMYLDYMPKMRRVKSGLETKANFRIVLDVGHKQYFDETKLSDFISLLREYFGEVILNRDNITSDDLNGTDLLIIPDLESNITSSELEAIKNYLENGGSLLIMGTWYRYFQPGDMNSITEEYGIYWGDFSVYDETNNDGRTYHPLVHIWANNTISTEMEIGEYISQVVFSGTALFLKTPTSTKVLDGPYFIGLPDNDTYLVAQNGSIYVPGINLTEPFGFFATVKLVGGGKIFASGSSETFRSDADPQRNYINMFDNKRFALLVVSWLLGVPIEEVIDPIITNEAYTTVFRPKTLGSFNFTIENLVNAYKNNAKVKIYVPYFLEVYDKIRIERLSHTVEVDYVPGEFINLGTIMPLEKVNFTIPLKGVIGNEEYGKLTIQFYLGDKLVSQKDYSIQSKPTFDLEAYFEPFYINISEVNYSLLYIKIKNVVDFKLENLTVRLVGYNESLKINVTEIFIPSLEPGKEFVKVVRVEVPEIGAYEVPVVVTDPYGSESVRRPFLLAITQKLIVFDEGHNQYVRFTSTYMKGLIDLLLEYGPVLINKGLFPTALLDPTVTALVVIPNPQPAGSSPTDQTTPIFTDEEITALQSFVEDGGSLLLMGNWYQYFWPNNPNGFNELTTRFGIYWYDGDLYDDVNNFNNRNYNVILRNFANNSVAKFLSSGVQEVYFSGTGFKLVEPRTRVDIYPILLGNNESYLTLGSPTAQKVASGTECILVVAAETSAGGRIIASGSSYMFSDAYYFSQNREFIRNMIAWLSKISKLVLEISPIPAELKVGELVYVEVKIKNGGVQPIYNITVEVEFPPGKILLHNSSTEYEVGTLNPGESKTIVWSFEGKTAGLYIVTVSAYGKNYPKVSQKIIFNFVRKEVGFPIELIIAVAVIIAIIGLIIYKIKPFKKPKS